MMHTFNVHGEQNDSQILIGESLKNVKKYIPTEKTVIITDVNVDRLYGHAFPDYPKIIIGTGEKIKNLQTIEYIADKLLDYETDRDSYILAIGGGIVCDIAGFVASVYLRGIRFGFVSSTLLSQVDASVGGKNGVNFKGYKNLIGVFNQPDFVICDTDMLATLHAKDVACGLAEIIKHTLIADREMFEFIENHTEEIQKLDKNIISKLIYNSVEIKSCIVNKDEKEKGERRRLNFGHTFGHAIEKTTGVSHGEAVSIGMNVACAISFQKGLLNQMDFNRIQSVLRKLKLPLEIKYNREEVLDAMRKDKKRTGQNIHFVLLSGIGNSVISPISIEELMSVLK